MALIALEDRATGQAFGLTNYNNLKEDIDLLIRSADGILSPGLYKLWDSVEAGVTLPAASVSSPSLPQTFKHLLIDAKVVGSAAGPVQFFIQLNGDTGANYESVGQSLNEAGTSASSGSLTANSFATTNVVSTSGFTAVRALIPAYTIAEAHLLTGMFAGRDGSHIQSGHFGGRWKTAAAVTSLWFALASGNLAAGSMVTVYGEA